MTDRFVDALLNREEFYSLGLDTQTGDRFLSTPIDSGFVTYLAYFRISAAEYDHFMADPRAAADFAEACRQRAHDDRSILSLGGVPK